jgi:hypothetical protein
VNSTARSTTARAKSAKSTTTKRAPAGSRK